MATITREPRSAQSGIKPAFEPPTQTALAPLLVATDSSESSDGAVRAALAIAQKTGQRVELIAVHEPIPVVSPEVQIAESPMAREEAREVLKARVLDQLARLNVVDRWPLKVMSGQPELLIADEAHRLGASLVIMGLGEHGLYERIMGDEMVLRVIRLGTVPVLAVAPGFKTLPVRILAATDFSPSSERALKLAESIATARTRISVAHVLADEIESASWNKRNAAFRGKLGRAFDVVLAGLRTEAATERVLLAGDPAKALLEHARFNQADLIATGSHGFGFLTRLWLGSVSRRLVRGAKCSVLIAPPQQGPRYESELPVTNRFAAYEWAEQLEEFTRRNAGRIATMEVIDPDLGAQIENRGIPFLGADFDSRDASIHIMLGEDALEGRHLTRTISGATALQVLRRAGGEDLMLRVAHGRGQTLVTLETKK